jgi:predicted ribosomally synthesized peptide with nif11-like leader
MTEKTFEQFLDALAENETLRSRMSEEMDAAALVSLGAEHGYEFTVGDLTSLSELELDEGELSQVTGGGSARFRRARALRYRGRGGTDAPATVSHAMLDATVGTVTITFEDQ